MRLALIFGVNSDKVKPKLVNVKDNLNIDTFASVTQFLGNVTNRNLRYNRVLMLTKLIGKTELNDLYNYWNTSSRNTDLIFICNKTKEESNARTILNRFVATNVAVVLTNSTPLQMLSECVTMSADNINKKYGIPDYLGVEVDDDDDVDLGNSEPPKKVEEQKKEKPAPEKVEKPKKEKKGFFSGLFGGKKKKDEPENVDTEPIESSDEQYIDDSQQYDDYEQQDSFEEDDMPPQPPQGRGNRPQGRPQPPMQGGHDGRPPMPNGQGGRPQPPQGRGNRPPVRGSRPPMPNGDSGNNRPPMRGRPQPPMQGGQAGRQSVQGGRPQGMNGNQGRPQPPQGRPPVQGGRLQPPQGRPPMKGRPQPPTSQVQAPIPDMVKPPIVALTCPSCGFELKRPSKFCPECGTKIGVSESQRVVVNEESNADLVETESQDTDWDDAEFEDGFNNESEEQDTEEWGNEESIDDNEEWESDSDNGQEFEEPWDDDLDDEGGIPSNSAENEDFDEVYDTPQSVDDTEFNEDYSQPTDEAQPSMENMGFEDDFESENPNINSSNVEHIDDDDMFDDFSGDDNISLDFGDEIVEQAPTIPQKTQMQFMTEEVNVDVGGMDLSETESSYRQKTEAPKVIEKVIEREVIRHVGGSSNVLGNVMSGKSHRVVIFTGDRATGVTASALSFAREFAKSVPVLYFDCDTERHGLLSYLDYGAFAAYDEPVLEGIRRCQSSSAFNAVVCRYDDNLDLLTTDYTCDTENEHIEMAQSIVAEHADEYGLVVVDCPIEKLHLLTDLIPSATVAMCVDGSKRGIMNMLCSMEYCQLNARYKRSVVSKGTMLMTRLKKNKPGDVIKFARSIYEPDGVDYLGMGVEAFSGRYTKDLIGKILEG